MMRQGLRSGLVAAAVVFVLWMAGSGPTNKVSYHVILTGNVTGLAPGAAVRYRGIHKGEVGAITLRAPTAYETETFKVAGEVVDVEIKVSPDTPVFTDTTASLADRARSYMESNCAHCHQPGGPTPRTIDLRAATARSAMNAIDVEPAGGDLGISGGKIIRPTAKSQSILWERVKRRDFRGMPPIGTKMVDPTAVELLGRWIDAGAN